LSLQRHCPKHKRKKNKQQSNAFASDSISLKISFVKSPHKIFLFRLLKRQQVITEDWDE